MDVVASTGSTNADVRTLAAAGEPEGYVLVADHQAAGRGRLGRAWTAPPRAGLAVSVLLRPAVDPARWSWLPLLAGLGVVDALRRVCGVDAGLKWPNDVLVPEAERGARPGDGPLRKVCGVLAEAVPGPDGVPVAAVVGFGLNVDQARGELPVPTATSLRLAGSATLDRDTVARACLRAVAVRYRRWVDAAGDPRAGDVGAAYREACLTLGRWSRCSCRAPSRGARRRGGGRRRRPAGRRDGGRGAPHARRRGRRPRAVTAPRDRPSRRRRHHRPMGLPGKLLAEGERPLLVLHPHARRLARAAAVLLVLVPVASYATASVPAGPARPTAAPRAGRGRGPARPAVRRPAVPAVVEHDLRAHRRADLRPAGRRAPPGPRPALRGVTDVVVSQRFTERLLGSGTLSVTTEGGSEFTVSDVPAVSLVQASLLAVADDVTARLLRPLRPPRAELGEPGLDDDLVAAAPGPDDQPDDHPDDGSDHGPDHGPDEFDDELDDRPDRPDRREARRRDREHARRLRELQTQVRRSPPPSDEAAFESRSTPPRSRRPPRTRRPCRPRRRRPRPPPSGTVTTTRPRGRASCASRRP